MINPRLLIIVLGLAISAVFYLIIYVLIKYGPKFYRFTKSIAASLGLALIKNEYIAGFLSTHQQIAIFLKKRSNRRSFWGLNATVLGLAFLYTLFAFLGLIEDFITSAPIVAADVRLNNLLLLFRSDYYVRIFLAITTLGRAEIIISVTAIISLLFWLWRQKSYILPLWLSLIGSSLLSFLSKLAFERPRPPLAVYTETSFSFPSGHATAAVAFYGFLIYFLLRHTRRLLNKTFILLIGLALILALGFSRLYLGVHYLSDVLAGYLLGALWLILGISFSEWQLDRNQKSAATRDVPDKTKANLRIKLITIILLLAEMGFSLYFALHYRPARPEIAAESPVFVADIFSLPARFTLPHYTETITAASQEPLSFMVSAPSDESLIADFRQAGWLLADPINDESLGKAARAALFNQPYPDAPMTPSFWDGETHTFGFEKATRDNSIRERNHARFWKTNIKTGSGNTIYVGTVSLDTGLKWGVTHRIAPDIDTERERLFQDLKSSGKIMDYRKENFVPPLLGRNFTGDQFFTDGQIYMLILK